MPVAYTEVSQFNHVCVLTPRVQSSLYDLMKRRTSPTCQLKFSVEAAILNIDKKVQELELKVDHIVNLLRKPQSGKKILVCFVSTRSSNSIHNCTEN